MILNKMGRQGYRKFKRRRRIKNEKAEECKDGVYE